MEEYLALIPAAGMGSRAQQNMAKQFQKIGAKCLIEYSIEPFLRDEKCQRICVVLQEEDEIWDSLAISKSEKIITCDGGTSRMESVHLGLKCLLETEDKNELVAIHDAARPCVSTRLINSSFKAASVYKSAVAAVALKDSIREKSGSTTISRDRSNYYLVQTPQTFDNKLLKKAYMQPYNNHFTDDASVVSSDGHEVHLIEGSYENIKITTDGDLYLARLFLSKNLA